MKENMKSSDLREIISGMLRHKSKTADLTMQVEIEGKRLFLDLEINLKDISEKENK